MTSSADSSPTEFGPGILSVYWVENIAILAWAGRPTAQVIEEMVQTFEARRESYPRGMSIVHIGRLPNAMVDGDAREAFRRTTAQLNDYIVSVAFVAPGDGFMASTLRSLVTGIMLVVRSAAPYRFHEHVNEVLEWLPGAHQERTGVTIDRKQLLETLERAAQRALR